MKTKLLVAIALTLCSMLMATEPPDPGAIQNYIKDGSFEERARFVKEMGNHRVRKDVAQHMLARMRATTAPKNGPAQAVLPAWQGMPTKGTNNLLVLLIDFPDYDHVNDASLISSKLFEDGNPAEFPKESLRNYYLRSSYNQLHLQGNALGWYRMEHERNWYTTQYPNQNEGNRAIILEALQAFDATHDFSQYDNDGNGEVDYFAVIWAGPDNGWGNFWWGYQWELATPITLDGVNFSTFSWQWESRPVGSAFGAETIIHETGHALGLPDYYDYDSSQGPEGGVGGLDMMAGNYGDHNAFSKFMLDWLTPKAIDAGTSNLTLRALARSPDAVAIMPDYTGGSPYAEYFMVENRFATNNDNDVEVPGTGLLVWHVDATPNERGEDFLYDNSYTAHKLLRLMEADGLEEIESGNGFADSGDYYNQGESFGEDTIPNSRAYNGNDTGVTLDNIGANGFSMNLRMAVQGIAPGPRIRRFPTSLAQSTLEGAVPPTQPFGIWATGGALSYAISDDASWVSVSPDSGLSSGATNIHTLTYSAAGLAPGLYSALITITAPDATNSPQTLAVTLTVKGDNIGRAVDATNLTWSAGGASLWFEGTTVSHDGTDAAQSGGLGDKQTNWIQTIVQGPGQLSFWWKVSSEANYDYLRFLVDGAEQVQRISGSSEWQPNTVSLAGGAHTLRWVYTKDDSLASGADAGWVDQVAFVPGGLLPTIEVNPTSLSQVSSLGQNPLPKSLTIFNGGGGVLNYTISADVSWLSVTPPSEISSGAPNTHTVNFESSGLPVGPYTATITIAAPGATNSPRAVPVSLVVVASGSSLAEALDFPAAVWTTGGSADWLAQTSVTHDGQDGTVCGDITHSQISWLETTVDGPGQLTFWWKASTEASYDYLDLYLDDDWTGLTTHGESDWRSQYLFVPPGTHTLTWLYSKDDTKDGGADTVWLDEVSFIPGGSEPETIISTDFFSGLPDGWQIIDNAFTGATWEFNDPCNAGNRTGGTGPFAIANSDCAGSVWMDTELITPAVDLSTYTNVVIEFKSDLDIYTDTFSAEVADVDVQINGGEWMNVWRRTEDDRGPKTFQINIPQADGQANVRARFHYYNAYFDLYWSVDNVALIGTSSTPPPRDYVSDWRLVWEDFDQNYSFFTLKEVDWQAVYEANTSRFASVNTPDEFAVELNNVLQGLHDWHVAVQKPDGTWLGLNDTYTNNHPSAPLTSYTSGASYQNLKGANAIYHAWVRSTLAHIVVTTLDDAAFASITDEDLDALFEIYQTAQGLILDLRPNIGGNETNALRIAERFTTLPRVYGYTRTRLTGNDHDAFAPFVVKLFHPSVGVHFTNNVACLIGQEMIGSAEWFALMMRACPQVALIGDRTRGATANEALFAQSAIDVSYSISRWIGYTSEQSPFEGSGITPQVALAPGSSSYNEPQQRDFVLERAIAWLRKPELEARPKSPAGIVINWPASIGSTYTLLRAPDLQSTSWSLAPGWTSNRAGFNGMMSYTNTIPTGREFYRVEIGP